MDERQPLTAVVTPRRIPPHRLVIAAVGMVAIILVALMYHDGVIASSTVAEVTQDRTLYRVKGTVVTLNDTHFTLRDDTGDLAVKWNTTTPKTGADYVVNGQYNATREHLLAAAVVRAYLL